jgi:hypothetical protein
MHDTHYAVVVGINRYPALGDLRGPVGDAASFVEWLVDPAGGAVPEDNIRLVPASPDSDRQLVADAAKPAVAEINTALRDINRAVAKRTSDDPDAWQRSRLYFFVAGHGMLPDDSDAALFAANATDEELGHNIELRLYQQWYRRCGCFRELVMFADCCRNQVDGAPSYGPPFTRCHSIDRQVRTVVGYGAEFGERAFEDPIDSGDPDRRRGYFTTALLRGLRRPRPAGALAQRWAELRAFVNQTVPALALANNRVQKAEMWGDDDVLFGPATGTATDVRYQAAINFPDGVSDIVDLLDGTLFLVDTWDARRGKWTVLLPSGLYCVVRHGTVEPIGAGFLIAGADVDVHL